MRILFAGNPKIAVPALVALSEMECRGEGIELAGLLTNPDAPHGRKGDLYPTEVSAAAASLSSSRMERGLAPIHQIKYEKLGTQAREEISVLACDLLVTFAYGRIFGPMFMALFKRGGINIHPSLLPRYRGPSPIPAAILNRDKETGITIQELALEMDTGDILAQEIIPLDPRDTTDSLSDKAAGKAAEMLQDLIPKLMDKPVQARAQEGEVVYCNMINREQGHIDWKLDAVDIDAQVRAYTPWPLSYSQWRGESLYILEGGSLPEYPEAEQPGVVLGIDRVHGILIQTGKGVYTVSRLQRQSKKALDWRVFLNGARGFIGSRLE